MKGFEYVMDVTKAFFGMLISLLIGTVTVLHGAWIGAVFYVVAVYSAVWLLVLLTSKGDKNGT